MWQCGESATRRRCLPPPPPPPDPPAPPHCTCSFHAPLFTGQDPHLQHIEQQYSRAQDGYDRDVEARDVLEGRPPTSRSTPQQQPAAPPAGEGDAPAPGQAGPSPGGAGLDRPSVNSTAGGATRSTASEDDHGVQITRPEGARLQP